MSKGQGISNNRKQIAASAFRPPRNDKFSVFSVFSVIQSCIFLFFMRVFHAAMFISPFISTAEADINAQANFCPLPVKI